MLENLISIPLIVFAISMCITPGPNNIMLAASGANYGFMRTVPHIIGIEFGMIGLFVFSSFGLGVLFDLYPALHFVMKIASSLYLMYFAYKIAFSKRVATACSGKRKPLTCMQAMLFQFINPKALIITSSALSSFTQGDVIYAYSAAKVTATFALICIPSISVWAGFGSFISRFMDNNIVFRGFNMSLGILTALSVLMVIK